MELLESQRDSYAGVWLNLPMASSTFQHRPGGWLFKKPSIDYMNVIYIVSNFLFMYLRPNNFSLLDGVKKGWSPCQVYIAVYVATGKIHPPLFIVVIQNSTAVTGAEGK